MLERRQAVAEIVLCWDDAARFKGGHVVRRDLVLEDGHIVTERRSRPEPIAGALQPGTAVGEVLDAATVELLREADERKRERDEALRQCEHVSARALGVAASLDQAVEERDATTALLAAERLLRQETELRAQDLSTALEAARRDAEASLAEAEQALAEERAAREQAEREFVRLRAEQPESAPTEVEPEEEDACEPAPS